MLVPTGFPSFGGKQTSDVLILLRVLLKCCVSCIVVSLGASLLRRVDVGGARSWHAGTRKHNSALLGGLQRPRGSRCHAMKMRGAPFDDMYITGSAP